MLQLIVRVLSALGTVVTASSILFLSDKPLSSTIQDLLIGLIVVGLAAVIWDVADHLRRRPKRFALNSPEIAVFMQGWLKSGGRAAVFSRDLTWVTQGGATESLLIGKAGKAELLLFVKSHNNLVEGLRAAGAAVHDYSDVDFVPMSRFTIIDYGKVGARVAVGLQENGKHVIREFGASDPAIMALVADLADLAEHTMPKLQ